MFSLEGALMLVVIVGLSSVCWSSAKGFDRNVYDFGQRNLWSLDGNDSRYFVVLDIGWLNGVSDVADDGGV